MPLASSYPTPSLVFTGAGGDSLGRYGYSKDHRPDLRQMFVAELLDGDGRPVCSEMWPGNTADVAGLLPVVDRVQNRLAIERICIVAYRGMISVETRAQRRSCKLTNCSLHPRHPRAFRQARARHRARRSGTVCAADRVQAPV